MSNVQGLWEEDETPQSNFSACNDPHVTSTTPSSRVTHKRVAHKFLIIETKNYDRHDVNKRHTLLSCRSGGKAVNLMCMSNKSQVSS